MPIKRTTTQGEPPKKRVTRRKRQEPEVQAAQAVGGYEPVISQDEKRRLILAHAAMRPTRDPVQFMSMWAGVLVAVLAVVTGWWWSVGSGLASAWPSARQDMAQGVRAIGSEGKDSDVARELERVTQRLEEMRLAAEARQREMDAVIAPSLATYASTTAPNEPTMGTEPLANELPTSPNP